MNKYDKLLEVYTLEEILENLDMEAVDILRLLDECNLLNLTLPEPL